MLDIKVKVLVEISDALASALDLEKALNAILKILNESLAMQRAGLSLIGAPPVPKYPPLPPEGGEKPERVVI